MRCGDCEDPLGSQGDCVICGKCKAKYHYHCAGMKQATWKAKKDEKKLEWNCKRCRTPRTRSEKENEEKSENEDIEDVNNSDKPEVNNGTDQKWTTVRGRKPRTRSQKEKEGEEQESENEEIETINKNDELEILLRAPFVNDAFFPNEMLVPISILDFNFFSGKPYSIFPKVL